MSQIYLINKTEIDSFVTTSVSLAWEKLKKFVLLAQEVELKELLCREFFFDVMKNRDQDDYKLLLNGEEYVDDRGSEDVTINYLGVKYALAHFVLARYIESGHMTDTAFSFVQKTNDFSEPISGRERAKLAQHHRNAAHEYGREIRAYLDFKICEDANKFKIYQQCCKDGSTRSSSVQRLKSDII